MFNFTDQVVIVSGATGNLGGAVAQAFAAAGATLVLPDRKQDTLASLFPTWVQEARHLFVTGVDLTVADDVDRLVQAALARYDRIDVLAHMVGGYRAGTAPHETAVDTWDFMLDLNARTTFLLNRAVAPAMLAQGRGRIINTASRSALAGGATDIAYAAAKSAVARITESMAAAYKKQGLAVNAIVPGTIDTPENRAAMPKADPSRWVTPAAIAQVVLFLASDAAAPINGALIPVYGLS